MNGLLNVDNAIGLIVLLALLSMIPFIMIMTTSFIKISVVLSLVRNALGVQQIPPNPVIYGLSIILSIYVMSPIINDTFNLVKNKSKSDFSNQEKILSNMFVASIPLHNFLKKNVNPEINAFFYKNAQEIWPKEYVNNSQIDNFIILIPSFTVSELTNAFKMGFMIYLPFIAIDLIISNILLAMGMVMVSPMVISIPFKLFLFVMIDGWSKLIESLLLSYSIGS